MSHFLLESFYPVSGRFYQAYLCYFVCLLGHTQFIRAGQGFMLKIYVWRVCYLWTCWCHVDNLCEWNWSSFIEIKLTLWRMLWWDLLKFDQPSAGCLYLSWFVVAICFVKVGWQDRAGVYRMSGRIWLFISREMLAILPQVCLWEWIWTVVLPPIIATFS